MAVEPGGAREGQQRFERSVHTAELRKQRARRGESVVLWLGISGLIGWSIALPTLAGVALGMWLDRHYPQPHSWTLTLLFIGLIFGCLLAWYWVRREGRS